jgi:hypothetical protein
VLDDFRTAPIDERLKALFAFLHKLNANSASIEREDVECVRRAGWTDEAIYDAITVCALFKFYNTWIDGSGVSDMPAMAYLASGRRLATDGYA